MPESLCPDPRVLERYSLGEIPEVEAERLGEHLTGCPSCLDTLNGLKAADTLTAAVRAQKARKPRDPAVEKIARKIKEDLADRTLASVPDAGPDRELYDFLAPAEAADELGRLDGYRVLKVLGSGGMGVVFLAEDARLRRKVAVKCMRPVLAASPSAGERFLREARSTAALKHDHVVTVYQVGEDRGVPFLAMEFLEGEPLDDRLKRERRLPWPEVVRVGREAAEGLAAAHAVGLIHRDVKPANLWLEGPRGRVKVLDFGLARAAEGESQLTQQGAIVGTPPYMSPEQARGEPVDARSDLFSLGCVLYRVATGELPFKGKDALSTLLAVTSHQPKPPRQVNPDIPERLSELIAKMLAKAPAGRPATARDVADALAAIERNDTTFPAPRPRRRPWLVAAVLVGVLLGGGGWLAGPALFRFATDQGEIVVEADDPQVEVLAGRQGVIIHDKAANRKYTLKLGKQNTPAGTYEIDVGDAESGLRFSVNQFSITRNGQQVIKVRLEAPAAKQPSPLDQLDAAAIPEEERFPGQPKELVAVLGESRGRNGVPVGSVAVSPDGTLVASTGSYANGVQAVRLWDAATLRTRAVLTPHRATAVAFSPDGKTLAANGWAGGPVVALWDLSGDQPRQKPVLGPSHSLTCLAFTPDGKRLASGALDGDVRVWDLAAGKPNEPDVLKGHEGRVGSVAFSADGQTLASAGVDKTVRVWDVAGGRPKERAALKDHPQGSGRRRSPRPAPRSRLPAATARCGCGTSPVPNRKRGPTSPSPSATKPCRWRSRRTARRWPWGRTSASSGCGTFPARSRGSGPSSRATAGPSTPPPSPGTARRWCPAARTARCDSGT